MKKILPLLIAFVISAFCSMTHAMNPTFNQDGLVFEVYDEENSLAQVFSYVGEDSHVVIPGLVSHDGIDYKVTRIRDKAFSNNETIQEVVIVEGIEELGHESFNNCSNLAFVKMSDSITNIGEFCFSGCHNLKNVVLPASIDIINKGLFSCCGLENIVLSQGITMIGDDAFSGCGLQSIILPGTLVAIGNGAFSGCQFKNIDIPETLNSIGNKAFSQSGLTSITLPHSVNYIGFDCFQDCKYLTNVHLENSNLKHLFSNLFYRCTSLTDISFPTQLETIGSNCFFGCDALEEIILPKDLIQIGGRAFSGCASLRDITFPERLQTIDEYAFQSCTSLTNLMLNGELSNVSANAFYRCYNIEYIHISKSVKKLNPMAFNDCSSLARLDLSEENPYLSIKDGVLYNSDYTLAIWCMPTLKINHLELPSTLKSIGEYSFYNCNKLEELVIPNQLECIEKSAFYGCNSLKKVTLPQGLNTIGISAFAYNVSLSEIDIPSSVSEISKESFYGCYNLTKVNIGNGIKSIGENAFSGASSLKAIDIPASVATVGNGAFYNCVSLSHVILHQGLKSIGEEVFRNDSTIISIEIPPTVEEIGKCAFVNCSSLKNVIFYDGLKKLGEGSFQNCRSLEEIDLSQSSIQTFHDWMFNGCTNLTSVILPASIQYLGYAFENCPEFTSLTCLNQEVPNIWSWYSHLDSSDWEYRMEQIDEMSKITFYVPQAGASDYLKRLYEIFIGDGYYPITVRSIGDVSLYFRIKETELCYGETRTLPSVALPNKEGVKIMDFEWLSSDDSIVSIDNEGNVTGCGFGKSTITYSVRDNYGNCYSASIDIWSVIRLESIDFEKKEIVIPLHSSLQILPKYNPSDATIKNLDWGSYNPDIVSVDKDGTITAHNLGSTKILARSERYNFWDWMLNYWHIPEYDISAEYEVIVRNLITGIQLDTNEIDLNEGEHAAIHASILPSNAENPELSWTSSNPDIATVDSNGNITAISQGETFITAAAADGSVAEASCLVRVHRLVSSLTLDHSELVVERGVSFTLTAISEPESADNKELVWSSSNSDIADVDTQGEVSTYSPGEAIITAYTTDGSNLHASCLVKVIALVESVRLNESELDVSEGDNVQLTAYVYPSDATDQTLLWTSDNEDVATVNENGLVHVLSAGTATITALAADCSGAFATCIVNGLSDVASLFAESDVCDIYTSNGILVRRSATHHDIKNLEHGLYILRTPSKSIKIKVSL